MIRLVKRVVTRLLPSRSEDVKLKRARALIAQSDLFDPDWYLECYPDVARASQDPLDHYIRSGGKEGRNPGPGFDAKWYAQRNKDVASSGVNVLLHYLEHGRLEGRSIRPVKSNSTDSLDHRKLKDGKASKKGSKVTSAPYPNEYEAFWSATPSEWIALQEQAAQSLRVDEARLQMLPDVTTLLEMAKGSSAGKRISLFSSTNPAAMAQSLEGEAEWRTVDQTGLGLEAIADGWFAHSYNLALRLGEAGLAGERIMAFQYALDGSLKTIANQPLATTSALIRLDLNNPLSPILLAWLDPGGAITATTLVLFPSLFRGGLHHAELLSAKVLATGQNVLQAYMAELASALFAGQELVLRELFVSLRGVTGSEQIFQQSVVDAIRGYFGITLTADGEGAGPASLGERLRSAYANDALSSRRANGLRLTIPGDCVPSLAVMCSTPQGCRLGENTLCITHLGRRLSPVLVCLPEPTAAMKKAQHPALPQAQPTWGGGQSGSVLIKQQFGLPVAVRLMDSTVWQLDSLMPLAPDTTLQQEPARAAALPQVSVLLNHSGSAADLDLCLHAIASQIDVNVCKIAILTSPQAFDVQQGCPEIAIESLCFPDGGFAQALTLASADLAGDVILFMDSSVLPHDRRTLAVLADICGSDGVAAASCPIVTSSPEIGSAEQVAFLSVPDMSDPTKASVFGEFVDLFPASTFSVAAADARFLAIGVAQWRQFLAEKPLAGEPENVAIAVSTFLREHGLRTAMTSLVRVATQASPLGTGWQDDGIDVVLKEQGALEKVAHIHRLLP